MAIDSFTVETVLHPFLHVCQNSAHPFRRHRWHRHERHRRGAAQPWLQGLGLRPESLPSPASRRLWARRSARDIGREHHGAEVVVISSAVRQREPGSGGAHAQHIPVIPRAEMLAELMRLKYGIAMAGMHGKTTTTSMVAAVLAAGGLDPTVVVGGRVDAMGSNARLGKSHYLVAEADESDRSFLKLSPILSVVTNIDREHMDCYRDMEDIERTFLQFMDAVPFYGMIVACNDNDDLRRLLPGAKRRIVTYGLREDSDFHISNLQADAAEKPLP